MTTSGAEASSLPLHSAANQASAAMSMTKRYFTSPLSIRDIVRAGVAPRMVLTAKPAAGL